MRWSIRWQVLVPVLAVLLGVVGLSTWLAMSAAQRATRQQIELQVRNMAEVLSGAHFPRNEAVLEQIKGLTGAEYILLTGDGRRLTTLPDLPADLPRVDAVADDWRTLRLGPPTEVGGQTYLSSAVRLTGSGPEAGATLYILYPEARWQNALTEAVRPSLWLGLAGSIVAVGLAVAIAQRLSRRIQELRRRTRSIAAGDFSPVPLTGWNDELRDLSESVNEMAQRLAQLQDTVKKSERLRLLGQVGGGLAHQLRNGVTGARLAVQLHLRECNQPADREALFVALRQLTLVESKLRRFLDLGQTEGIRREPCSVNTLIDEAVGLLRPQCQHARVSLTWQPPPSDCTVLGDAGQLGQVFLNVIGNAVEAAGPGGRTAVRLQIVDCRLQNEDSPASCCRIEVIDSGPGPPAEIAVRLFEPFVTGKSDGIGLGLAVARQVVEAHGGRIDWRREEQQTVFRIELPVELPRPSTLPS